MRNATDGSLRRLNSHGHLIIKLIIWIQIICSIALATGPVYGGDATLRDFGFIYKIGDIVVRPPKESKLKIIMISVSIEVKQRQYLKLIAKTHNRIVQQVNAFMYNRKKHQLNSTANRQKFRADIRSIIEKNLPAKVLSNIYLTNFVVR